MWAGVLAVVDIVWNALQTVADYVIIALTFAVRALKVFAGDIWTAAKWTYQDILKPVGQYLHDGYERLKALYDRFGKPVVEWARRVTKAVRGIYDAYFRPILSAIDGVRRVLELLTLLHVEWASQLDKALAELERKITQPVQQIIAVINSVVNRIESFVLTADNLFRRATLIGSIARDLNSITNMHWRRQLKTLRAVQAKGPKPLPGPTAPDDHIATLQQVIDGDSEAVGVDIDGLVQVLDGILAA